jgi:hypothetical protein
MHSLYMRTASCLVYLVLVQAGRAIAALQQASKPCRAARCVAPASAEPPRCARWMSSAMSAIVQTSLREVFFLRC